MAKTSYLNIPPELEEKYYSGLQSMDRFIIPRIKQKTVLLSNKKITEITSRSLLKQCAAIWNTFTDQQKQDWKNVDTHPQKHGYRSFIADRSKRILLGLEGTATPNQYHQDMIGKLLIKSPADEIKLTQPHPSSYFINQKVVGKKNMYEPVEVSESFSLPLKININYKSNLTSTGEGSFAHFYASIRHLYQGQNLNHNEIIEIPLSSIWAKQDTTISTLPGLAISYNLYLHLYKVIGTLLFDNVKAEHSGQNWARDTYCKKIEQSFSRGFYQIPQHWAPITLPEGASYKSVYPQ